VKVLVVSLQLWAKSFPFLLAANKSVLVHQVSKHQTQSPFKRTKGSVQRVAFHPTKPHFFVAVSLARSLLIRFYVMLIVPTFRAYRLNDTSDCTTWSASNSSRRSCRVLSGSRAWISTRAVTT
jgi:hypothetical protein